MAKIIDPHGFKDTAFTRRTIKLKPSIPNFKSITKRSLEEKAMSLFNELGELGLPMEGAPKVYFSSPNGVVEVDIKIPYAADYQFFRINHIKWQSQFRNNYFVTASANIGDQLVNILLEARRYYSPPYSLTIMNSTNSDLGDGLLVQSLPITPYSVAFEYDFNKNPYAREKLEQIGNKKIGAEFFSGREFKRSSVVGIEDENGLRVSVHIYLQEKGFEDFPFLKCYEIELIKRWNYGIHPDIQDISPESIWQPDQQHYCLSDKYSFPLLPVVMKRVSNISFMAHPIEGTASTLVELLSGLPLSVDGKNQWFAQGYFGDGDISMFFNPEWQYHNTVLRYEEKSPNEFSAGQIYKAVSSLSKFHFNIL